MHAEKLSGHRPRDLPLAPHAPPVRTMQRTGGDGVFHSQVT